MQTEVEELSSRRNPLRGFRKYEEGLVLHSPDYWMVRHCYPSGVYCEESPHVVEDKGSITYVGL